MEKNNVLFRYLSMAFPHGVKISKFIENPEIVTYISEPHLIKALHFDYVTIEDEPFEDGLPDIDIWSLDEIKPYLRPMESMTEKEREWYYLYGIENKSCAASCAWLMIDWLLENHFDFLGLIPKGLAIEINEENNPYKR